MYADFESILKPENEDVDVTQDVDTGIESSSHDFQEHIPCSFAYKIVGSVDPDFSQPLAMYRSEDVAEMFVSKLQLFDEYIATPKPMLLSATESQSFTNRPPAIYAQNRLKMIMYETIETLQETIVVVLTTHVTCCIEYPKPVGSCLELFTISKVMISPWVNTSNPPLKR